MSDTHDHLWSRLSRHRPRHTMRYNAIHIGFYSTLVLMLLMALDVFVPQIFASYWFVWIIAIYVICQLTEYVARDPLNWSEIAEGHLFASVPAIGGLILLIINGFSIRPLLTPFGLLVLKVWVFFAWICFVFGFVIALRAVTAPYRRDEIEQQGKAD